MSHALVCLKHAAAVTTGFLALSLAMYIWRADAGASAPSVLLVGVGVFAFSFTVTYLCRTLLARDGTHDADRYRVPSRDAWNAPALRSETALTEVMSFDGSAVAFQRGDPRPADEPTQGPAADRTPAPRPSPGDRRTAH